jgi:hypothetical protein
MKRILCLAAMVSSLGGVGWAAQPAACASPEHRQFDFWIGSWDVFETQTGMPAGHSLIERVYDGCALRENWSEPGFTGGSLNHYGAQDGRWRQTWTDSAGAWREFVGGLQDGRMVLVWRYASKDAEAGEVQVRMTFTPEPGGEVRQYSDVSSDGGRTWRLRYDYTYRPARTGA